MNPIKTVPYYTHGNIVRALSSTDCTGLIRHAYTSGCSAQSMPAKFRSAHPSGDAVIMPFEGSDGLFANKVMLIAPKKMPGIFGWMTMYNIQNREPVAMFDATALTGIRTAAKSLLMSQYIFSHNEPVHIHIYGSSTQAYFHFTQFYKYFVNAQFTFIVRSESSKQRLNHMVSDEYDRHTIVHDIHERLLSPHIIITTTKSPNPIITDIDYKVTKLMIAVGSSTGEHSEIAMDVISKSHIVVDAKISVDGKGELKMALDDRYILEGDIIEFRDVLLRSSMLDMQKPVLFVSKGIAIEDYVFAKELMRLMSER